MTSAALASTSAAISTRAARLAVGAVVSYQILLIVLICETGSGSFLAHDQRVGYRALHLDGVGRVSHFGAELCGFIRDAAIPSCIEAWAVWDSAYC
jgi:hypothetical protein